MQVQPSVSDVVLSDPALVQQGFFPRFLIAQRVKHRVSRLDYRADPDEVDRRLELYGRRILDLFVRQNLNASGALDLRVLKFSADAVAVWREYKRHVEREQQPGRRYADVTEFASKSAEQCGRIAGVLTLFDDPRRIQIDAATMKRAVVLVRWYLAEAQRILEKTSETGEIADGVALIEWVKKRKPDANGAGWTVSLRDMQRGLHRFKRQEGKPDRLMPAVKSLESSGAMGRKSKGSDGSFLA